MKRFLSLMLVLVMCFSLAACGGKDENKLVIGYTIYEPMNYMEDGKLTGFDTEFAEAVCEKLGLTPEFVEINWDTKFVTLDSNKIDCIWNGMTISDEVKKNCSVSKAYVKNAQVVVMNKDVIENYKDAENLEIIAKSLSSLCEKVIITGVHSEKTISTIAYEKGDDSLFFAEKPIYEGVFYGSGDLFASAFIGMYIKGASLSESTKIASDFVNDCILNTLDEREQYWYGLKFEQSLGSLIKK